MDSKEEKSNLINDNSGLIAGLCSLSDDAAKMHLFNNSQDQLASINSEEYLQIISTFNESDSRLIVLERLKPKINELNDNAFVRIIHGCFKEKKYRLEAYQQLKELIREISFKTATILANDFCIESIENELKSLLRPFSAEEIIEMFKQNSDNDKIRLVILHSSFIEKLQNFTEDKIIEILNYFELDDARMLAFEILEKSLANSSLSVHGFLKLMLMTNDESCRQAIVLKAKRLLQNISLTELKEILSLVSGKTACLSLLEDKCAITKDWLRCETQGELSRLLHEQRITNEYTIDAILVWHAKRTCPATGLIMIGNATRGRQLFWQTHTFFEELSQTNISENIRQNQP